MGIERTKLSGSSSSNAEDMAPVASTSSTQNQAAPKGGQGKPRPGEPLAESNAEEENSGGEESGEKDSGGKDSAEDLPEVETDRPPHRIDNLA